MKAASLLAFFCLVCFSCDRAKDMAKDTLHKGGEIVGKAGSEIADGVRKGVEESFSVAVDASPSLKEKGLQFGKIMVTGTDSTSDNILTVYIIFDKRFSGTLTAKAIDKNGLEFGRSAVMVSSDSGDAKFVDFIFDRRTDISREDRMVVY